MPRGDGTGPQGQGAKTGRGRGKCNPQEPSSGPQNQRGRGPGRQGGQGRGKSGRQGSSIGRGYGWATAAAGPTGAVHSVAELAALRNEADYLKDTLDAVNRRIDKLEQKPVDES
jgi:hypothetical protein